MKTNLDINSFTANGKNYRASEAIVLSDVEDFLAGMGYTIKSIGQPWRNVFAHLESADWGRFFKLASTSWVGERLKNEIDWNTQLVEVLGNGWDKGFIVPKILDSGIWNERPYYVSEYFPGAFVQEKIPGECHDLEAWLTKIVDCNLFLLSLDPGKFNFYRDREFPEAHEYADSLAKRVESWIVQVPERDFSQLWSRMSGLGKGFAQGVNHGDFVPWHMIMHWDKFALIDGEHGSAKTLRYYDIAYFYHRVYTVLESPVHAKKYLTLLIDWLEKEERALFESQFPKVLASRIIGGYFDAKHDWTDFAMHDRLHEEFLTGTIIQK